MSRMTDFTVPSTVPGRTLHAFCCEPEGEVRAVLQLSHGMVEFIDRYKPLAEYLAGQGIVVVGHDHLGHGGSIRTKADYGYFAEPDGNQNYLKTGELIEIVFPENGVRYIAINDGVDTAREDNEFTPLRNWFNEFYARGFFYAAATIR